MTRLVGVGTRRAQKGVGDVRDPSFANVVDRAGQIAMSRFASTGLTASGALTGATLQIIPQRLVIQSWRSTRFNAADPDSTLILAFTPEGTNGRINLVHLDVPAHNYQGVVEGWETHYWGP